MLKKILAAGLILAFLATPALSALTIAWSNGYPTIAGNKKMAVVTVTFDSSYPKGTGESFTPAMLGFTKFDYVSDAQDTVKTWLVTAKYDYTNSVLKCYHDTLAVTVVKECYNGCALDLFTAKFFVSGD